MVVWCTNVLDPESAVWWFRVALGDLLAARAVANDGALPPRLASFLAQQAAEKALKAVIAFAGTDPPRTHNLVALSDELRTHGLAIGDAVDLVWLTDGARSGRYPDAEEPVIERSEVAALLTSSQSILDIVRIHLAANGVDLEGIEPT